MGFVFIMMRGGDLTERGREQETQVQLSILKRFSRLKLVLQHFVLN